MLQILLQLPFPTRGVPACCLLLFAAPAAALAAPVLTAADARIEFRSPTSCTVALTVSVSGAVEVEHRLALGPDTVAELAGIDGADEVGPTRDIGRTRALIVRPRQPSYTIRYAVSNADSEAHRCALWLPTTPADGRSRNVRLHVQVPPGATPGGSMPGFLWTGERGEATLGHLPAFVRVSFAEAGARPSWDVSRIMDVITLAVIAGASLLWLGRKRAPARTSVPSASTGASE